ncbi:MAG: hypothetical protein RL272_980 [Candidatus Parcubacteria bacterium]
MERDVVGRRVEGVTVRFGGRLNLKPAAFAKSLSGAVLVSSGRRAKLLILGFSNGYSLVAHLKMTGRFLLVPAGSPPTKHTHVVFRLSGGKELHFEDVRKFGYLRLYRTGDLAREVFDKEAYGPEPLDPSFTAARFAMCVRGRGKKRIKPLLMEQTCIAGIGNIYADESLWRARIRPQRKAGSLDETELRRLHDAVRRSLRQSLGLRGTSADTYVDLYGRKGDNLARLKAYGRQGKPCGRCGGPIKKITFAGRGTHFCPACQK